MDKLVEYAEEGNTLARHDDVPEAIRKLIYRHEEEKATPPSQPSNIRTLTSINTTPTPFTDTLYYTVDTSHLGEEERANVSADTV